WGPSPTPTSRRRRSPSTTVAGILGSSCRRERKGTRRIPSGSLFARAQASVDARPCFRRREVELRRDQVRDPGEERDEGIAVLESQAERSGQQQVEPQVD